MYAYSPASPSSMPIPNQQTRESTPVCVKASHTAEAQFGYTEAQREAALVDAERSTRLVDISFFLNKILPPVESSLVARVLQNLETNPRPTICRSGRLRGFPQDPCHSAFKEARTFQPLVSAINAIIKEAASSEKPARLMYKHNPDMVPNYAERKCSSRPDGGFLLVGHILAWIYTICFAEFKKTENEAAIRDNIRKIVWSMFQAMRDDGRRRFCFGLTIENTTTRFWFGSRGGIFASTAFNVLTDHRPLVHFVLALAFAEEQELGWDTTMFRLPHDITQFDIQVRTATGEITTYRTEEVLSNHSAECMLGRGTRVYKARLVINGTPSGDAVIVKDTWIDFDRRREGDILADVRHSQGYKPTDLAAFDAFFLSVLSHGDVGIQHEGTWHVDDHNLILRGNSVPANASRFDLKMLHPLNKKAEPAKGLHFFSTKGSMEIPPSNRIQPHENLVHYRIVFREVCRPIFQLRSLQKIFYALSQTFSPLSILHNAGCVHRDVSIANILIDESEVGGAKLSDLEYAVQLDATGKVHAIRTGTDSFMAVEVERHQHQFYKVVEETNKPPSLSGASVHDLALTARDRNSRCTDPTKTPERTHKGIFLHKESRYSLSRKRNNTVAFRYNPLHDMESLWWVAAYFVFKRQPTGLDNKEYEKLEVAGNRLFSERAKIFFGHNGDFVELCDSLPGCLIPFGDALELWRLQLCQSYAEAAQDLNSISSNVANMCIARAKQFLGWATDDLGKEDIVLKAWDAQASSTSAVNNVKQSTLLEDRDQTENGDDDDISTVRAADSKEEHNLIRCAEVESNVTRSTLAYIGKHPSNLFGRCVEPEPINGENKVIGPAYVGVHLGKRARLYSSADHQTTGTSSDRPCGDDNLVDVPHQITKRRRTLIKPTATPLVPRRSSRLENRIRTRRKL